MLIVCSCVCVLVRVQVPAFLALDEPRRHQPQAEDTFEGSNVMKSHKKKRRRKARQRFKYFIVLSDPAAMKGSDEKSQKKKKCRKARKKRRRLLRERRRSNQCPSAIRMRKAQKKKLAAERSQRSKAFRAQAESEIPLDVRLQIYQRRSVFSHFVCAALECAQSSVCMLCVCARFAVGARNPMTRVLFVSVARPRGGR